jgi:ABC-type nitrate/sulfonate/bicarbonate transport system substrate-binding protein
MASVRNKRLWIIGSVAAVAVVAIFIGAFIGRTKTGVSGTAANNNLITITTYTRKDCTSTPILVADEKGFFAAQGLQIKFTGELKQPQILPSILNGNNDFAEAHPNALAMYIAGGATIKGVARSIIEPPASVNPKYRHMWYFVKPGSPIKSWSDLKNYKVGQQITINGIAPSCESFIPSVIFDKYGIGRKRIKLVTFDTDQEALQALEQGSIDIAQVHPPFYKMATDSGLVRIGDSSDSGLGEAAGLYLYYFTDSFINQHPDIVQKFVNAVTQAQIWANAHPVEASAITSKGIGVTATGTHYYSENTVIPEAQVALWVNDLVKNGFLKPGQVTMADMITHRFEVH